MDNAIPHDYHSDRRESLGCPTAPPIPTRPSGTRLIEQTKYLDISLRSDAMSLSSLLPSAGQFSRSASSGRFERLVCVSLVSEGSEVSRLRQTRWRNVQGSREDIRGRLRMRCASMAMWCVLLPMSLFSSRRRRFWVRKIVVDFAAGR